MLRVPYNKKKVQATSKGIKQTVRMHKLVLAFAGRICHHENIPI